MPPKAKKQPATDDNLELDVGKPLKQPLEESKKATTRRKSAPKAKPVEEETKSAEKKGKFINLNFAAKLSFKLSTFNSGKTPTATAGKDLGPEPKRAKGSYNFFNAEFVRT